MTINEKRAIQHSKTMAVALAIAILASLLATSGISPASASENDDCGYQAWQDSYNTWFNNGGGDRTDMDQKYDTYLNCCLLYTSPSPRDATLSRMPSSA